MARLVDLHHDRDAHERAVLLHGLHVFGRVLLEVDVGALVSDFGHGGEFEGPGLRVRDVPVQTVEFAVGERVDGAVDVGHGFKGPRGIEVQAAPGEFGSVGDGYGGERRVGAAVGVRVEELGESG